MVRPSARMDCASSQRFRRACGSRPVVGSSRKRICGSFTRAVAMLNRCFWPPDSVLTFARAFSDRSTFLRMAIASIDRLSRAANRSRSSSRFRPSKNADDCSCTPMTFLTFWGSRRTSIPPTRAWPSSALRRPSRISTVVVLPAPFGPSNPKISRCLTRKAMPSTATRLPYRLRSPSTTIAKPSVCVARPESPGRAITLMPQPIIAAASVEARISDRGRRRHCLLHDDDHLARLEAQLAVDRQHAGIVGAVIGVHHRDSLLRRKARHQHLQHARDPSTAMAAQHAGVPHLGIAVRAPQQVAQADDVVAVAGHEEAVEQHGGTLVDASRERLERRIPPLDVGFVRHVAPDRRVATIELLARALTIDLRQRDRLDAALAEPLPPLVEPAEIHRGRPLS